jgi:hypothetical protein
MVESKLSIASSRREPMNKIKHKVCTYHKKKKTSRCLPLYEVRNVGHLTRKNFSIFVMDFASFGIVSKV